MPIGVQSGLFSDVLPDASSGALASVSSPLIVIVGETASGKSALAMELALRFNGEIICADSWTVYKGFDIGTAKPSVADRARVPHHLLDIADPVTGFSAPQFQRLAVQAITDITSRMRLPILVGGTGLYVDSVLFNYGFLAPSDPQERVRLEAMTLPELQLLIDKMGLDASGIDLRNKRRVVRFIENNGAEPTRHPLRENTLVLGMSVPRDELNARVAKRVDEMLIAGLESEVCALAAQYGWDVEPMKGIGYREWRMLFDPPSAAADRQMRKMHTVGNEDGTPSGPADSLGVPAAMPHAAAAAHQIGPIPRDEVRERVIRGTLALAK
jgi:tRNA dimethylallyltransferase